MLFASSSMVFSKAPISEILTKLDNKDVKALNDKQLKIS